MPSMASRISTPMATRSKTEVRRSHTDKRRGENRAIKEARIMSRNSIQRCLVDFAVGSPVKRVNEQSDDQPDKQTPPGFRRQAQHCRPGREDSENRHQRNQRRLEWPRKIGPLPAQNPNARAYDNERQKRPNIHEYRQISDGNQ